MIFGLILEERIKNHGLCPETQVSRCFGWKQATPNKPKWLGGEPDYFHSWYIVWRTAWNYLKFLHHQSEIWGRKTFLQRHGRVDLIVRACLPSPITPVCSIQDQDYPKCYYKINQGNTHLYVSAFVTCEALAESFLPSVSTIRVVATTHNYWDVWSDEITYGKKRKTAYFQKMLAIIITINIIISNMVLVLYMLVIECFLWVPFVLLLIVPSGELGK